jgi:hypothetical protein
MGKLAGICLQLFVADTPKRTGTYLETISLIVHVLLRLKVAPHVT